VCRQLFTVHKYYVHLGKTIEGWWYDSIRRYLSDAEVKEAQNCKW
jgi:hypothetical protein